MKQIKLATCDSTTKHFSAPDFRHSWHRARHKKTRHRVAAEVAMNKFSRRKPIWILVDDWLANVSAGATTICRKLSVMAASDAVLRELRVHDDGTNIECHWLTMKKKQCNVLCIGLHIVYCDNVVAKAYQHDSMLMPYPDVLHHVALNCWPYAVFVRPILDTTMLYNHPN